tara:strand:- start:883 stop:1314 length:432 start_codon:yes stop_codon:yes gene_type:complete
MIYIRNLSSNNEILLLLKELLNHNIDLCKKILKYKNEYEISENRIYYLDRYEKIAKEHYYLHKNHENKFSFIHDTKHYVLKKDFKLDFYNYTGISYQTIELIHELIKLKNKKDCIEQLNYEDKLYSLLSIKIANEMNNRKEFI